MRRKVKRTLTVRTTETWTITWHAAAGRRRQPRPIERRRGPALPPTEPAKGDPPPETTPIPEPAVIKS